MMGKRGPQRISLAERVERNSIPEPNSGCWLWMGAMMNSGYGLTGAGGTHGRTIGAHQAAWLAWRGAITPGLFVCHHCDVKACVNPDHLYLASCAENTQHAKERGRMKRGEQRRNARFCDDQIRLIRALRERGESSNRIAEIFNVDGGHIRRVLRGEVWSHVR